ncbi:hypothetical protein D1007_37315 [Hordeum vulgare]|nr:hypothetical protein D1007_37315 [Hordeum vulgare]
MAAAGAEWQFAINVKLDTHNTKTNLSMVYVNDQFVVENSINTTEQLRGEDVKYKVVGFNLKYTDDRVSAECIRNKGEQSLEPKS